MMFVINFMISMIGFERIWILSLVRIFEFKMDIYLVPYYLYNR